jgi:hypothetical protein
MYAMKAEFIQGNVRGDCPDCGVPTSWEFRTPGGGEFGSLVEQKQHTFAGETYGIVLFKVFRCVGCSRPGVAKLHQNQQYMESKLEWFWPTGIPAATLPSRLPTGVMREFREAETCMSAGATRGAAALLRSALEKVLTLNGYDESNLYKKIDAAGRDAVITAARQQKAQDMVRTLGNDVLHDDWREVTLEEVDAAHLYVARICEDLYDDRPSVEKALGIAKRNYAPA